MGRLADRPMARARRKRRAYPIHAYVGPNGTGKSALMIYDTLPSLDFGRQVMSTVRLLDFRDPHLCGERAWDVCDDPDNHEREGVAVDLRRFDEDDPASPLIRTVIPSGLTHVHRAAHRLYVPLRDYTQLVTARDCDVLLDEVTGVAGSRESMALPTQVANILVQLRRRNATLRWSSPSWNRADKIIREVSQAATLLHATCPGRAKRTAEDGTPLLWSSKRLFNARTYDPTVLDEFEAHKADRLPTTVKAWYWGPGSLMFEAYDTLDPVTALGWANDAGMCLHCGGKRATPKCGCADHRSVATLPVRLGGAA
jgi:hypothetical protein